MARNLIPSEATIRAVKPGDPRSRLSDGDGLFLLLSVKGGSQAWRLDYRFQGKRNTLSLGTYPDTSLALARRKADAARKLLAEGFDPSQQRKAERETVVQQREVEERQSQGLPAAGTFEAVAREWFAVRRDGWSKSYGDKVIARLESDVFPWIGRVPAADITGPQLLAVMRRIEARGVVETAHRALQDSGQVFRYAVATGHARFNPAGDLKDALRQPNPRHFPAIVEPKRLGELLRAMHNYAATPVVRAALKLAPMLLLRPGELRFAEWSEIDLDAALWSVPAARMKRELRQKMNGTPHLVPLPKQAVEAFRELQVADRAGQDGLPRRAAPRPGDEREHGQRGVAGDGLLGRRGHRPRLPGDGAHDAARAARLQPGRDRGAAGAHRARQPRPCLQPDRVRRAAARDAADLGGLPGSTAQWQGDMPRKNRRHATR